MSTALTVRWSERLFPSSFSSASNNCFESTLSVNWDRSICEDKSPNLLQAAGGNRYCSICRLEWCGFCSLLRLRLLLVRSASTTCCRRNGVCAQIDCAPAVFVTQVREMVLIRSETMIIMALVTLFGRVTEKALMFWQRNWCIARFSSYELRAAAQKMAFSVFVRRSNKAYIKGLCNSVVQFCGLILWANSALTIYFAPQKIVAADRKPFCTSSPFMARIV